MIGSSAIAFLLSTEIVFHFPAFVVNMANYRIDARRASEIDQACE
jgi:hypothetical protein